MLIILTLLAFEAFFQGLPKILFENFCPHIPNCSFKDTSFLIQCFTRRMLKDICNQKKGTSIKDLFFLIKYYVIEQSPYKKTKNILNQLTLWKSNQIFYFSILISYLTIKKNIYQMQKCTSKTCHIIMPFFSNLSKDTIFYFSWSKVKKKIWNMKFHFSISIWSFCWCVKYQIALWTLFSFFCKFSSNLCKVNVALSARFLFLWLVQILWTSRLTS